MTTEEAKELIHGIYWLHWKDGSGPSMAAVGSLYDGTRWFAPTNWTSKYPDRIASIAWGWVEKAEFFCG